MPDVGVIVVAAGKGRRLSRRTEKPYVLLGKRPLLCHCLDVFQSSTAVGEIVLVVHPRRVGYCRKRLLRKFPFAKVRNVVAGGRSRQESVARGLRALSSAARVVVVHDAARPFVSRPMVEEVVRWARKGLGVTVGMPVSATIKKVNAKEFVLETPLRDFLREIQTPQAFPRTMLEKAHAGRRNARVRATDDAGLVERSGDKVKVIPGSTQNFKITNREDLWMAELLLKRHKV